MSNRKDGGDVTLRDLIMPDDSLVETVLSPLSPVKSSAVQTVLEEIDLLFQLRDAIGPADRLCPANEMRWVKLFGFALARLLHTAGYETATKLLPLLKPQFDDLIATA